MAKKYEIIPGIVVTDIADYLNLNKRMDISKYKQFNRNFYSTTIATQTAVCKVARNKNLSVVSSYVNDRNFTYKVMINADTTKIVTVPYEEICETMQWKSFTLSKNHDMLTFDPIPTEEIVKPIAQKKHRGRKQKNVEDETINA